MVYNELRALARQRIAGDFLGVASPTSLVNDLYIRLYGAIGLSFVNRAQFFGLAAQMMRCILVDAARSGNRAKRGGGMEKIPFEEAYFATPGRDREIVALDDALSDLAKVDARKARIVELRFFGGLTIEETAEVMEISIQTVRRDWAVAQAWLAAGIARESGGVLGA